jgi:hypothetical protein
MFNSISAARCFALLTASLCACSGYNLQLAEPGACKTDAAACGGEAGVGSGGAKDAGSVDSAIREPASGGDAGTLVSAEEMSHAGAGGSEGDRAGGAGTAGAGENPGPEAGRGGTRSMTDAAAGSSGTAGHGDSSVASPRCGNGVREGTELCDGADCSVSCMSDNACIVAALEGSATSCDVRCTTAETTMCGAADGCCPMGCNHGTDMDCSPSCGDGVLSGTETCEPGSAEHPCPSDADCDDRDVCTEDSVTGSTQQCSARCAHKPLTRQSIECDDGDPCTDDERVESASSCSYECKRSEPKRPSGSCVDNDPCTDDSPRMSTTACEVICPHAPVLAGTPCGAGRMCSADGRCEEPPAECGDRVVSGAEACDVGARSLGNDGLPQGTVYDEWSCDENCRRLYLYTPCSSDSQCGAGGWCNTDRGRCGRLTKCQPGDPFTPNDTSPQRYNCELPNGRHGVCLSADNCIPLCATAYDCPDVGCLVIGAYSLCEIL